MPIYSAPFRLHSHNDQYFSSLFFIGFYFHSDGEKKSFLTTNHKKDIFAFLLFFALKRSFEVLAVTITLPSRVKISLTLFSISKCNEGVSPSTTPCSLPLHYFS